LVALANQNASNALQEHLVSVAGERVLLERLEKKLRLSRWPSRIECFDNSNIAGSEPVAGMVVFENGRPAKSEYRRYRIKNVKMQDDYAYMAEVLSRRFSRQSDDQAHPDLLIVDGGKGQLGIAAKILASLGLSTAFDLIGIAKKDEAKGQKEDKIYKVGRANPVNWGADQDTLLFLQRIRDEAHRFAIGFHRQRRRKTSLHSALDDIPGIGKVRKTQLLKHFGSVARIKRASIDELVAVSGINHKMAEVIREKLSI
jgi:excinuclease ABC subunit C